MKNIILLMLDTVRAKDIYGNNRLPVIGNLAKKGTAYTGTVAPGTWTAPTHAALFMNSKVSSINGVAKDFFTNGTKKIDPWMVKTKFLENGSNTIASRLSRYGYYSVLFSNNPFITSSTNMAIGFDKVYDVWMQSNPKYNKKLVERISFIFNGGAKTRERLFKASYSISKMIPRPILDRVYLNLRLKLNRSVANADGTYRLDRGAMDTNSMLEKYLKYGYNYASQFIFINYIEAHENYPLNDKDAIQDKWLYLSGIEELTDDTSKTLHNAYLRRLSYLDRKIGKTIDILKKGGMLDDATVILTSDHGQMFGEKGMLYHAMPPYEEIAKVPLISVNFKNGKIVRIKEQENRPVSLLSLHNAILGLASGKYDHLNGNMRRNKYIHCEHMGISEGWDEQLLMFLKDKSSNAQKIYKAKRMYNKKVTAIYNGNMKLVHFFGRSKDQLYDISNDPNETTSIIEANRGIANNMLNHINDNNLS